MKEFGNEWEDKPVGAALRSNRTVVSLYSLTPLQNDILMWLMEEAPEDEQDIRSLTLRILTVNFAAVHTSSMVGHLAPHLVTISSNFFAELYQCIAPSGSLSGVYPTTSGGSRRCRGFRGLDKVRHAETVQGGQFPERMSTR